ncbi:hypothetical protein [Kitasatospora sp. NPDC093558]|uniref:hypothetical protein n=1 Tax=Kitasatospora sp. NPDC093558 TaxID=3155201 RepID=UPI0034258D38
MSIGTRTLQSTAITTVALTTAAALTLGLAGTATADTAPTTNNVGIELPVPPGTGWSEPAAVNDKGVIVGFIIGSTDRHQAVPVRWNADLSIAALPLLPGDPSGEATGVNGDGTAIGFSGTHPARWSPAGTVSALPLLPGDTYGRASGINSAGTVIGSSQGNGHWHAVAWTPDGTAVPLAPLAGDTETTAVSVNSSGTVAGFSSNPAGTLAHAVIWGPDGTPTALDAAGDYNATYASQINDAGTVIGRGNPAGDGNFPWHSVIWTADGSVTDLGPLTYAQAVNSSGTVVGNQGSNQDAGAASRWSPDGTRTELGGQQTVATAINDAGVAVGYSWNGIPDREYRSAKRWNADGTTTDLTVANPQANTEALVINGSGLIAGVDIVHPQPYSLQHHAVIWKP